MRERRRRVKKVTIQDIAQQMKLSRNTVAKALNDGAVSYETKMSVLSTAYEMGYPKLTGEHLSLIRQMPSDKSSRAVLVLSGRSQESFWNQILTGISTELNRKGYRMLLQIVEDHAGAEKEAEHMLAPDVAGLIFLNLFPKAFVENMARFELPMAFFDAPPDLDDYLAYGDIICPEGWFAMEQMVKGAVELGYREFGFMGYAGGSKSICDRYGGFLSALQKRGLKPKERFCFTGQVPCDYYDYHEVERIMEGMEDYPEVFVCANDAIAKYIACALHKKDPEREEKLVLIGFDHTVEPGFFRQNIYSVNVNKEDLGRRLAKSVLDQIQGDMEHALILVRSYPDLM